MYTDSASGDGGAGAGAGGAGAGGNSGRRKINKIKVLLTEIKRIVMNITFCLGQTAFLPTSFFMASRCHLSQYVIVSKENK